MDNQHLLEQSLPSGDKVSMSLTFGYILLHIFSELAKSTISFWLAVAVGGTTLLYNGIKIFKELKNKKQ